ncbi:hypothetical protein [Marivirga tractuosa]|nr:hypothetical protein [Marivirga tractuosa]
MQSLLVIIAFIILITLLVWSYVNPWLQFKKVGVSLTFKELMNPAIKKDLPLHRQTKRLIKSMSIAQDNNLPIRLKDLLDAEIAGADSHLLVDAQLLISEHGLHIDNEDLHTLILADIDFTDVVKNKVRGQKISAVEELSK